MDPAEQALLAALEASPGDWSIRLLIAGKYHERGAVAEAAELIEAAPEPPHNDQQLQQIVHLAGERAIGQLRAYIGENPADGYAQHLLGFLLEQRGDSEKAAKHFQAAQALGFGGEEEVAAVEELAEAVESSAAPPPINQGFPQPDGYLPPPPQQQVEDYPLPRKKRGGDKATAILVAIAVHVAIGIIAALLVILPPAKDDPEIVAAVIGPPAAKQEMQKKNVVKKVKKSTSAAAAAAPVAQLMRASAMAKFSLPKVTKTSTGPLGMGEGNLGSGGFGGTGSGLGSGASFFGGTAKGQRFLFVLDHSASMKPNQVKLRNAELDKALKSLNGVQYQVLLFAGAAYYAEKGWSIQGQEVVKGPGNKTYRFKKKTTTDFEFSGPDSQLPKAQWLDATATNKKATMDFVNKNALFIGTDWEMALRIAHYMDPPPDVIFFMSDGTGGNNPKPILAVNRKKGSPVINTVAMQTSSGAAQFAAVARGSKGTFTIVDKKGKPIDGFDYLKNPGKYRGKL